MSRRLPFTQADVSRAVKGARAAGLRVARVEINLRIGKIVLLAGQADTHEHPEADTPRGEENEWDEVLH